MQLNPSLYEVPVPHTTRPAKLDEIDGKDYHFVARHIFEADVKQNRFIEQGEYEKYLFGTTRDAIQKVIENGKICILNLFPTVSDACLCRFFLPRIHFFFLIQKALKMLRSSDFMPFVIYIGPPNLSKLKELKQRCNESIKVINLKAAVEYFK